MTLMAYIVGEGMEQGLTQEKALEFERRGIIYWCQECEVYHLKNSWTWEDLERIVQEEDTGWAF